MAKKRQKKNNNNNAPSLQERKEILQDLDAKMDELKTSTAEMSENMKQLLSGQLKDYQRSGLPEVPEEPGNCARVRERHFYVG